jgi:hypothetical protein
MARPLTSLGSSSDAPASPSSGGISSGMSSDDVVANDKEVKKKTQEVCKFSYNLCVCVILYIASLNFEAQSLISARRHESIIVWMNIRTQVEFKDQNNTLCKFGHGGDRSPTSFDIWT